MCAHLVDGLHELRLPRVTLLRRRQGLLHRRTQAGTGEGAGRLVGRGRGVGVIAGRQRGVRERVA
jgi:hypothetical protein